MIIVPKEKVGNNTVGEVVGRRLKSRREEWEDRVNEFYLLVQLDLPESGASCLP